MKTLDKKTLTLKEKVENWIAQEGYPLEFQTAHVFRNSGFWVLQGHYVKDEKNNQVREIDVLAISDKDLNGILLRIEHIIECKWILKKEN